MTLFSVFRQPSGYLSQLTTYNNIQQFYFSRSRYRHHKKPNWQKKAENLIWGLRKYSEFTESEKSLVNIYQMKVIKNEWKVLPNTGLAEDLQKSCPYDQDPPNF